MKIFIYVLLLSGLGSAMSFAQRPIRDDAIRYQQERMVFKQWNKDKFVPKPGFLYLNPLYWMTWAWHPNYPDTDHRPLGSIGPQTQRLALVLAMQQTTNNYKLQADTLRNTAVTELSNYSGLISSLDPLWMLYYSHEFAALLSQNDASLLNGLTSRERQYLLDSGLLEWYKEESEALAERLNAARNTNLDRGSRILAYHRMLAEYRKLISTWEAGKQRALHYLSLGDATRKIKESPAPLSADPGRTDKQIAEEILSKSKL